jgi:hypothetical protein
MLTSYFVKCPHLGCDWLGSLLPRGDAKAFAAGQTAASTVGFQCPRCRGEWRCRVVGDDVVPVTVERRSPVASA